MTTATQASHATPKTGPQARRGGRGWLWLLGLAALAAAAGGAWYYQAHGANAGHGSGEAGAAADKDKDAQGSADAIAVETVGVTKGGITRTNTMIGSVKPFREADLYAKISGYLKTLNVDYGTHVKKGDVLAEIDDPEVVKERDRSAATLVRGKAAVKQAEAAILTAKADWEAAKAAVATAEADIERTTATRVFRERVLARYKDLVGRAAVPQAVVDEREEDFESAKAAEKAARAAVITAKAKANAAEAMIVKAEADRDEAKAKVGVDEAELGKAEVFVDYTKIVSPYDGVITRREFFPGAFIRSASEGGDLPVLSVAQTDKVRVATYVTDLNVPFAKVGSPVEVSFDALPGEKFKAKISRFSDKEDSNSRTMYTEIDVENKDEKIRPGMYGRADIDLGTDVKGATIPSSCLVGEAKDRKGEVYVVKQGKARKAKIEIGADDGIRLEVLSGLKADDQVILNTGSVSDGVPVKAVKETESEATAVR